MAGKIGIRNAVGNRGGQPYSKDNREKAATLKGLSLDWMLKVMKGKDEKLKKEVVMKIATTCLPQVIAGDDESPLVVKVINYGNNYTPPIPAANLSVKVPPSTSTLSDSSLEQKGWQVQDGIKPTDNPNPA